MPKGNYLQLLQPAYDLVLLFELSPILAMEKGTLRLSKTNAYMPWPPNLSADSCSEKRIRTRDNPTGPPKGPGFTEIPRFFPHLPDEWHLLSTTKNPYLSALVR